MPDGHVALSTDLEILCRQHTIEVLTPQRLLQCSYPTTAYVYANKCLVNTELESRFLS